MAAQLRGHFFLALGLCLPALLLNPYGYELPLDVTSGKFYSASEREMFAHSIGGWEPTSICNGPPYYAVDYLVAAMAIYLLLSWRPLKHKQIDWVVILAFLGYSFLYVIFIRATYFWPQCSYSPNLDQWRIKTIVGRGRRQKWRGW